MDAFIRRWGNSPAVRLTSAVLKEAGLELDQKVELVVSRSRIVIQPVDRVEYDLDALVQGISAANRHEEVDFGAPVGKEVW